MLSTRFSTAGADKLVLASTRARRWLKAAAVTAALGLLSACQVAPIQPQVAGPPGPAIDPAEPVRVALLVPLGTGDPGRDAIGRSLVNAAQLAQSDLQGVNLAMRVYETAGTTGGGASAARRAVEEGAQIIVGPLFSTETAGAGPVAAQAGLPVLSFSNNADVAGGNVYLLGISFDNSADRVVSYAASRGLRNVGVVYPQGLEGETARRAVAAAARRHGSSLVAQQGYELSVQGIERGAGAMAERLRGAGANAVVIADLPTGGLGFVADGLRNRGLPRDSAQFLGMHRWDVSAEVLAQSSLQGSWFAAPDPAILGTFESRYRAAYGQAPHEIAGLAYDGIAAVGALVREAQGRRGQSPFAAANITNTGGFAGVYGPFRFLPNGLSQRNLAIREVRGGSAPVIDRAPRAFVGLGS